MNYNSTQSNIQIVNNNIPFYLIVISLISIGVLFVFIILIIVYLIWRFVIKKRKRNQIFFEEQNSDINKKQEFKSIPNSSTIENSINKKNINLIAIKERNLKDEIHNIIHNNNNNIESIINSFEKKKKRKNIKKSTRNTTKSDEGEANEDKTKENNIIINN
jgi:biopolymer transport protein ExbB/TolQ